jgi:hypothetical protein
MATKTEGRETERPAAQRRPDSQGKARAPEGGKKQGDRDPDERRRRIAEAAYYRAERRGFAAGYEDADWLDAEKELDSPQGDEPDRTDKQPGRASARRTVKPGP